MTESSVVNAWIAEGEAKGEARGEVRGSRAFLVRIGAKKFGNGPTDEQRETLDAISDLALLTQLIERLLDVNSWDELIQVVVFRGELLQAIRVRESRATV